MKTIHSSFIILVLLATIMDVNASRRVLHLERFEACDRSKGIPLILNHIGIINPASENVRLSINFTLTQDLRANPRVVALVMRCASKEALDTCLPFTTLRPINTCSIIAMPNMAWSDLANAFKPPFKCPFKKGDYILNNGTVDANLFNFFPLDNYYWRSNITFYVLNEYATVCADIRILKIVK